MPRTLNLGILAHVDAGKTTLTERLLYDAGVIDEVGSVDDGSTQTDSLALERQRGITIKSAVVSFAIGDLTVNLIDTPGHPDFIAEVERVLGVLDGAVLVISAVEGVQAQTRVLMRTLQRLRVPTILFVNKLDRAGAAYEDVLRSIAGQFTPAVVEMGSVRRQGTRAAGYTAHTAADAAFRGRLVDVLTQHDDALLAAYVEDERAVSYQRLRRALATQTGRAAVHPVYAGSAVTGAGVEPLTAGIRELLPPAGRDPDGPVSGTVFKIERGRAGEKVAYVRMFSGTVWTRQRLRYGRGEGKVTAIQVFDRGPAAPHGSVAAGQIGKLWGLGEARIGDPVGEPETVRGFQFAPPTLETVVRPRRLADRGALHAALTQLAEQDPLINLRQDDLHQEISVSLYGEVQKEIIQATLASEYRVQVWFEETTTIRIERPAGTGAAVEVMTKESPFRATVGLRVDPAEAGSGVRFGLAIERGALPVAFQKAVEEAVHQTLRQGLHGWQVTDCTVTLTDSGYVPPPPYGWSKWSSSAGDFRHLTPLVLMSALKQAGTRVYEPIHRFQLDAPADTLGPTLRLLAQVGAAPRAPTVRGTSYALEGEIPAARMHELQQRLPGPTRGEGVLALAFDRYQPVAGSAPTRPRTDHNPLDRQEYLLHVGGRM